MDCFSLSFNKYATPPVIPLAMLLPSLPKQTTVPPVMYSSPWSLSPSTTLLAPLFLIANLSPTSPLTNKYPLVAPYRHTLPQIKLLLFLLRTTIKPPLKPLPT
eukprot:NODE_44_length_28780_cov_0.148496.p15 type:complete len:103 gc:universal NODE_44_length_28780_cov_0.148496:13345-13037(-)